MTNYKKIIEKVYCLPWVVQNYIRGERGDVLEFRKHSFLIDIFDDWTPVQTVRKASQIGFSTMEIIKSFWAMKNRGWNIIYTLPTFSDVSQFVPSKVNAIIGHNPILQEWTRDKDTILQKKVGNSFIYYRGTQGNKSAEHKIESGVGIMFTADLLIMDEADRSDQSSLQQYESRLEASDYKGRWYFSNPTHPNTLTQQLWEKSDQKHWFIKCVEPNNVILVKNNKGEVLCLPIEMLFDIIPVRAFEVDNGIWVKYPSGWGVYSAIGNGKRGGINDSGFVDLNRVVKSVPESEIIGTNLSSSYVETSIDHKFILNNGNDRRSIIRKSSHIEKKQKDLMIGDEIITIGKENIGVEKNKKFSGISGWLLGFYLAEGSLFQDKNSKTGYKGIVLCQSEKEKEIIEKVEKELLVFGDRVKKYSRMMRSNFSTEHKMRYWTIFDSELARKFQCLGQKYNEKILPINFFQYSNDYVWNILAGLIDGDGAIGKREISIRIGSKALLFQLHWWLRMKGIRSSVKKLKGRKLYGLFLSLRDKDKLKSSIKIKKNRGVIYKKYNVKTEERVKGFEKIEQPKYVYDLTTKNGLFYLNGVLVHNCSHCGHWQYLSYPESIKDGKFVCKKCGREITDEDRINGRWVKKYQNRDVSGYWISQLIAPWHSAKEIEEKAKTKTKDYFNNFVLGLPYRGGDRAVDRDMILGAIDRTTPNFLQDNVMGVDVGLTKHYVIGNKQGIFKVGTAKDWEEIEFLMKKYDIRIAVFDALPDLTEPRKLQQKYLGIVWLSYFKREIKKADFIVWDGKSHTVYSDRGKMLGMLIDELADRKIRFQMKIEELETYIKHWDNVYRTKEIDNMGLEHEIWDTSGENHFCLATLYWRLALERIGGSTVIIDTATEKMGTPAASNVAPAMKKIMEGSEGGVDWRV